LIAGTSYLEEAPWHHATGYWVAAYGLAALGGWELFGEIRRRYEFWEWFRLKDRNTAAARTKRIRRMLSRLPPWYKKWFDEKQATEARAE
jgi:hypothetical protein